MKPYYLALILFSCSKVKDERPQIPEAISFTQTRVVYNNKGTYEGTLIVIHYHRVDDPVLIAQYKDQPAIKPACDEIVNNDTIFSVVSKPCPADCELK